MFYGVYVEFTTFVIDVIMRLFYFFFQIETTAFVRFIDDDAKSEAEEKMGCFQMKIKLLEDPNASSTIRVDDNQEEDE